MKTRALGNMGMQVTEIGFGAWPIGGMSYGPVEREEGVACLEAYLEGGGNFIDTARRYGESESIIGEVLESENMRDRVLIASKTGASGSIETIPDIRKDLEESLRLLKTDCIDLYYLHNPPDDVDTMNAALDEFEQLRGEGKIRAIGASIKGPSVTDQTHALCIQYIDTGRVDALQIIYSILRQRLDGAIGYAESKGVGIVARTIIENGFLSGKYKPGHEFSEGHRRRWGGDKLRRILEEVERIESRAVQPPYESLAQVSVRFPLEHGGVSTVIPGARTAAQSRANAAVGELPALPRETLDWLKEAYADTGDLCNPGA